MFYFVLLLALGISPNISAQSADAARQPQAKVESKRSALDLDRLLQDREYPEMERQLPGANLSATERSYFEGILADRNNQVSQAIATLEKILPGLRTANSQRAAVSLRALTDDYFLSGRYGDASDAFADLMKHFADEFSRAHIYGMDPHIYESLRDAAPQSVSGERNFSVAIRHNSLGVIDVPLQIGDKKEWWIFDTGASISTITVSTANRLGLTISRERASTQSSATGKEVPIWITVIPQIRFGSAIAHDAVAQVMDDKDLDINLGENGHYQIEGILGYPVLEALGSFTFTGNELTVAPESQPTSRSTRLYVDEMTPLVEATAGGHELIFGFDTGAFSSSFSAKYFRKFPHDFASLTDREYMVAGAGGTRSSRDYELPRVELELGSATATFKNVDVLTSDLGAGLLDEVFGNLGQDVIRQFKTVTIDFKRMRLSVGEEAK
jgi:predicted aspartyl protease